MDDTAPSSDNILITFVTIHKHAS